MEFHERFEETKLYPYLCQRFDVDLKYLVKEHKELDKLRSDIFEKFEKVSSYNSNFFLVFIISSSISILKAHQVWLEASPCLLVESSW